MYEVIGLKDFGTWLKKGEKCLCTDTLTMSLMKRGYLRVLGYHLTESKGRWDTNKSLQDLKEQGRIINMKIKAYEEYLETHKEKQE